MTFPEGGSGPGQGSWWEPQPPPQQPPGHPGWGEPAPGAPAPGYPSPQQAYPPTEQYPALGYPPQQFPPEQPNPTQQYGQPLYGPQYPQQQGYDQYGTGPGPLPPNRNRNLAIVLSVAAVVLVGLIVAVVVLVNKNGGQANSASSSTSASTSASSIESGSSATTGPDSTATAPQPTIAGWTAVTVGSGVAADVPPDWSTGSAASAVSNAAAIAGLAACSGMPSSFRAIVEPLTTSSSDANVILQTALQNFNYDKDNPQVALAPPHPTADGSFQDYRAVIGLTPPTGPNCDPPQAIVHILVKTAAGGSAVAIAVEGDQQCNEAVDPANLDKIANSVRSYS